MKRAQLYNSPEACVDEALSGLVLLSQGKLRLLQPRIVVRSNIDKSKVALVSLGGAGHEPAHAGYVGHGMLTGAVSGNVFASPPALDILNCLVHVTGDAGTLLIIKNYTGDVVNARIAKERAEKEYGLKVATIISADDCATKSAGGTGARGIAGTLFLHKIAGAMAEKGASLEDIVRTLEEVKNCTSTMGMSFSKCRLPGQTHDSAELPSYQAELGQGIHGESGVRVLEKAPSSLETAKMLVDATLGEADPKQELAILINNLGAMSNLEMLVFSNDVLSFVAQRGFHVGFVGMGSLMTTLDSAAVSLSVLKCSPALQNEMMKHLNAPTNAIGWMFSSGTASNDKVHALSASASPGEGIKKGRRSRASPELDPVWIERIRRGCELLINAETVKKLNSLDAVAGDGDTGTSISQTATALLKELQSDPPKSAYDLLEMAQARAEKTGGSFGGMLSVFFQGTLDFGLDDAFTWSGAWQRGLNAMEKNGGAKVGDRSFMDALIPALSHSTSLKDVSEAARKGANSTANLIAKVGRACYVPRERYVSYNDAGAEAVALFLHGLATPE